LFNRTRTGETEMRKNGKDIYSKLKIRNMKLRKGKGKRRIREKEK
jgi:hypothetical protein